MEPLTSAQRLLWDIEHACIRVELFSEKYDVFRTDEDDALTIVRLDSKGSNSITIPDEINDEDDEQNWKEKVPLLLKKGTGTDKHLNKIIESYNSSKLQSKQSYFRPSWYDDADNSLITGKNGAMLFEREFDEEEDKWKICLWNRCRGGRYSKMEKLEDSVFYLDKNTHQGIDPDRTQTKAIGENHLLYPLLRQMCGQPNDLKASFFKSSEDLVRKLRSEEPMAPIILSQEDLGKHYNTVVDWLVNKKGDFHFNLEDLLQSAIRASDVMKTGIDTGTKKVRFPSRGFKDTSDDDNDIPREEDRNAKVFLLAISVYGSGNLFSPVIGSYNNWSFHSSATQEEMRNIHKHAELLVRILVERTYGVINPPLTSKTLSEASVTRALSYLKGERTLFRHQLEGLEWCLRMEKSEHRGGFVACDMGMGKTVQTLLLHLCYPPENRGKTLVVVPPGLLRQPWYKEATDTRYWGKNLPFGKPLLFIRDKSRKNNFPNEEDIKKAQLVISSYNVISSNPILQQTPFRRVILDESTYIKNTSTLRAMAVRSVRADFHWCLSGTPVENKKEDYLGQLLFLHISPYYHQDWWFERFESDRHRMFYSTMFKRNFQNIIDGVLIEHPVIKVEMDDEEKSIYDKQKDKLICAMLGSGDLSSQGTHMMALLRLSRAEEKINILCKMCAKLLTPVKDFENEFHKMYYKNRLFRYMMENKDEAKRLIKSGNIIASRNSLSEYLDSIKDDKNIEEIDDSELFIRMFEMKSSKKPIVFQWHYVTDSKIKPEDEKQEDIINLSNRELLMNEKCVIFVQGADRANEIKSKLEKQCPKKILVRPSGNMKGADEIIENFQTKNEYGVLILTFRGGAHGLNLQIARNVFLVDPDWNPAIIMQAIARCFRIGQTRDVHVYNLVTANSLEERVQQVIQQKMKVYRENISGVGEDITEWKDIQQILESSVSK